MPSGTSANTDSTSTVVVKDALGNISTTVYGKLGSVTTSKDGNGRATLYEYNVDGLHSATTTPAGGRTEFGYDNAGRLVSLKDPMNRITSVQLDGDGNPTTITDPALHNTLVSYRPDNQIDQVTQRNAAMVEEATAASQSLAHEAEQLADLIGHFTVGGGQSSAQVVPMRPRAAPARSAPSRVARGNTALAIQPTAELGWEEF